MSYYRKRKRRKKNNLVSALIELIIIIPLLVWILFPSKLSDIDTFFGSFLGLAIAVLIAAILFKVVKRLAYDAKMRKSHIRDIDVMSGEQFEDVLAAHFRALGYKVDTTPKSYDYGADLVMKKDGIKYVVQAKRYGGKVSNSAIQEIVGAKAYYKADKAMVVTNSFFTKSAVNLAEAADVELWDRNDLINNFSISK